MEKKHVIIATDLGREEAEGARRATGASSLEEVSTDRKLHSVPNPEVPEKAVRRRFPAAYKLRILKEAESCTEGGQYGAFLRREGIYASHLTTWRRQAEQGTLEALSPRKGGPKVQTPHPLKKRVEALEKENQQLRHQLKQAETIIEVQKKLSEILRLSPDPKGREEMMKAVAFLSPEVGVQRACDTLGIARASYFKEISEPETVPLNI